eukprot:COSAG01_NODE_1451_length_10269_cov_16.336578_3_plen_115_part_00
MLRVMQSMQGGGVHSYVAFIIFLHVWVREAPCARCCCPASSCCCARHATIVNKQSNHPAWQMSPIILAIRQVILTLPTTPLELAGGYVFGWWPGVRIDVTCPVTGPAGVTRLNG